MPFCRKCGRRLPEYSESCPECKTSTTGPIIKVKKAPTMHSVKAVVSEKAIKSVIPVKPEIISVKVLAPTKATKTISSAKPTSISQTINPAKPPADNEAQQEHEIIKSNISLKKDIITNPQDYETKTFSFDLKCSHDHFWQAGKAIPVSNGKAFCLKCGEQLRNPREKIRPKYRRF
jgi:hypothetical protein